MKKYLKVLLLICIVFQCNAEQSEPLCGSIKEIRKTEGAAYTIVWNEPAPEQAALVLTSSDSTKKALLMMVLPVKRTISPSVLPEGYDPFALPTKELKTPTGGRLEMTSQLSLDASITNRTIISIYMCSATFAELEQCYIKKQ